MTSLIPTVNIVLFYFVFVVRAQGEAACRVLGPLVLVLLSYWLVLLTVGSILERKMVFRRGELAVVCVARFLGLWESVK